MMQLASAFYDKTKDQHFILTCADKTTNRPNLLQNLILKGLRNQMMATKINSLLDNAVKKHNGHLS